VPPGMEQDDIEEEKTEGTRSVPVEGARGLEVKL